MSFTKLSTADLSRLIGIEDMPSAFIAPLKHLRNSLIQETNMQWEIFLGSYDLENTKKHLIVHTPEGENQSRYIVIPHHVHSTKNVDETLASILPHLFMDVAFLVYEHTTMDTQLYIDCKRCTDRYITENVLDTTELWKARQKHHTSMLYTLKGEEYATFPFYGANKKTTTREFLENLPERMLQLKDVSILELELFLDHMLFFENEDKYTKEEIQHAHGVMLEKLLDHLEKHDILLHSYQAMNILLQIWCHKQWHLQDRWEKVVGEDAPILWVDTFVLVATHDYKRMINRTNPISTLYVDHIPPEYIRWDFLHAYEYEWLLDYTGSNKHRTPERMFADSLVNGLYLSYGDIAPTLPHRCLSTLRNEQSPYTSFETGFISHTEKMLWKIKNNDLLSIHLQAPDSIDATQTAIKYYDDALQIQNPKPWIYILSMIGIKPPKHIPDYEHCMSLYNTIRYTIDADSKTGKEIVSLYANTEIENNPLAGLVHTRHALGLPITIEHLIEFAMALENNHMIDLDIMSENQLQH